MTKKFTVTKISSELLNQGKTLKWKVEPFTFDSTGFLEMGKNPVNHFQWVIEEIYFANVGIDKNGIKAKRFLSLNQPEKKHFDLEFNENKISFCSFPQGVMDGGPADSKKLILLELYEKDKVMKIELNDKFEYKLYDAVNWKWLEDENFDPVIARDAAIELVKKYWRENSSDKSETGKIREKDIKTILGADWEEKFTDKNTKKEVNKQREKLIDKVSDEIGREKIKVIFTTKSVEPYTKDLENGTKGLKIKLKEEVNLTFFCHFREKELTWKVKEINFVAKDAKDQYDLLVNSKNQNFELNFDKSQFFHYLKDVNFSQSRPYAVFASESWTGDEGMLKVYHCPELADAWNTGKVTIKKRTKKEQPDSEEIDDLTKKLQNDIDSGNVDGLLEDIKKADELGEEVSSELKKSKESAEEKLKTLSPQKYQELGESLLEELMKEIEQALTSASQEEKEELLEKLTKFINSEIDYKKMAYQAKEKEVKKLLNELEKQQTGVPSKSLFRKEVVIPVTLIFGLVVVFLIMFISARRKKNKKINSSKC